MKEFYGKEISELVTSLKTNEQSGLTTDEVRRRITEYGYNQIESKSKKSIVRMFFEQFRSFMIIILLVAAAISGVVGIMEGEGLLDTWIILGILIVNALIGAVQEKKAETSLEALKELASPLSKVLRDGAITETNTKLLVPGDIVILETGAVVPADIRLTEAVNLKIQESSLTGESLPVDKITEALQGDDIPLGDRKNMAFSSGMVTYGRGRGVVVATGIQTEVGKIADMLQHAGDTETPMSKRLNQLGKMLGIVALVICAVIFGVGVTGVQTCALPILTQ
jgi:Ca2+-transporting ATPase